MVKKDLVVISNGIHTELAEKVSGAPVRNEAAGTAMIRFLIPMEEVANDPRTKPIHEAGLNRFLYGINPDGRNFVSYPCKGYAILRRSVIRLTVVVVRWQIVPSSLRITLTGKAVCICGDLRDEAE